MAAATEFNDAYRSEQAAHSERSAARALKNDTIAKVVLVSLAALSLIALSFPLNLVISGAILLATFTKLRLPTICFIPNCVSSGNDSSMPRPAYVGPERSRTYMPRAAYVHPSSYEDDYVPLMPENGYTGYGTTRSYNDSPVDTDRHVIGSQSVPTSEERHELGRRRGGGFFS